MKFVWDMDEEKWEEFAEAIDRGAYDVAKWEGYFLGYCRVGDLCFDIRAWHCDSDEEWNGWGFELFVGGIDDETGGYSSGPAMDDNPEYKSKYDVPDELLYPYANVGYGEFEDWFTGYSLKEFQEAAEPIFEDFIIEQNGTYKKADLLAKANEPLNIW